MEIDPLDESVTAALRAWQVQHGAGIAVAKALESCAAACRGEPARECFLGASRGAAAGTAEMLRALEPALSRADLAVLAAGWKGGRVEQALQGMAARRELWARARRRVRGGLLLPLGVLLLASFVAPLPAFLADGTFAGYLVSALAPLAVAYLLWRLSTSFLKARTSGRTATPAMERVDRLLLSLPVLREVERQSNLAECAGLLGLLEGAGVPLNTALEACADAVPNSVYRQELRASAATVTQGRPLSSALRNESLWPAPFVAAVVVGEKTGALEEILLRLGNEAREEYARAVERFSEWLPKIVYGMVGLFVIWQIFKLVSMVAGIYEGALH